MMTFFDKIYATMLGTIQADAAVPWVENAFTPGSFCSEACEDIWDARMRLYGRLDSPDDDDVQIIVDNFYDVQEELCQKMFLYGMMYAKMKK